MSILLHERVGVNKKFGKPENFGNHPHPESTGQEWPKPPPPRPPILLVVIIPPNAADQIGGTLRLPSGLHDQAVIVGDNVSPML
jgi:hypothetical protein